MHDYFVSTHQCTIGTNYVSLYNCQSMVVHLVSLIEFNAFWFAHCHFGITMNLRLHYRTNYIHIHFRHHTWHLSLVGTFQQWTSSPQPTKCFPGISSRGDFSNLRVCMRWQGTSTFSSKTKVSLVSCVGEGSPLGTNRTSISPITSSP